MFENIYPIVFGCVLSCLFPSSRKRKTGINPYVFKNTDSAHDFGQGISTHNIINLYCGIHTSFTFAYFAPLRGSKYQ